MAIAANTPVTPPRQRLLSYLIPALLFTARGCREVAQSADRVRNTAAAHAAAEGVNLNPNTHSEILGILTRADDHRRPQPSA